MTETAIVVSGGAFIAPVVDVRSAMMRYQAMKDFIDGILHEGVDYGKIPGTDKNTLLKPGAEKLSSFFGLAPKFEIVEKELDWMGEQHGGEAFFYFHYRCRLMRGESMAAEGEGSASSWEKKYRYRNSDRVCPNCGKSTIIKGKAEYGGGWICFAKKGGCGAKYADNAQEITGQVTGQVKNPDVADIVNTLQKMAQKRAYVAAVLLAVNGSEYFTQDVEDFIDAEFTVQHPAEKTQTGAAQYNATPAQVEQNAPVTDWPTDFINLLATEFGIPAPRVKATMQYCKLPKTADYAVLSEWMNNYKTARGEDKTTAEAAEIANGVKIN